MFIWAMKLIINNTKTNLPSKTINMMHKEFRVMIL